MAKEIQPPDLDARNYSEAIVTKTTPPIFQNGYAIFVKLSELTAEIPADICCGLFNVVDTLLLELVSHDPNKWFPNPFGGAIITSDVESALGVARSIIGKTASAGIKVSVGLAHGNFQRVHNVTGWNVAALAINVAARMASVPEMKGKVLVQPQVRNHALSARKEFASYFGLEDSAKVKRTDFKYHPIVDSRYVQKINGRPRIRLTNQKSRTAEIVLFDIEKYSEKTLDDQTRLAERLSKCVEIALAAIGIAPTYFGPAGDGGFFAFLSDKGDGSHVAWTFAKQLRQLTLEETIPIRIGIAGGPVLRSDHRMVVGGCVLRADAVCSAAFTGAIAVLKDFWTTLPEALKSGWQSQSDQAGIYLLADDRTSAEASVPQTLEPLSIDTLRQAEIEANEKLELLKNATAKNYSLLINEEALVGHLPRWQHLYMEAYGAFTRVNKERQVLADIDQCVGRLLNTRYGMVLHVLAGDSGCGKSTLAKQIIRRLIEKKDLHKLHNIQRVSEEIRFFEVKDPLVAPQLEKEISRFIQPKSSRLYFFYVDDLFVLDDNELNKLLQVLKSASENAAIYIFATSPNWIFDNKDLQEKKKTFHLLEAMDSKIHGLDAADHEALKSQYLQMHGDNHRPALLAGLEQTGNVLILSKLALHHNLTYSQYFDQLFNRMEQRRPKYLAALLLFSTLARFYVHFPLTLLKQLNLELEPNDRLPEATHDYVSTNDAGLRLFRVRFGTRSLLRPEGMPDTIAPFHDRIAQVIYETWGENRRLVPIFNCSLRDLRNMVYQKLDQDRRTRPILANVFRGHLRVADEHELRQFVSHFGPVRGRDWILADDPIATTRWFKFAQYDLERTGTLTRNWERILVENSERNSNTKIDLALAFVNPEKLGDPEFKMRIQNADLEGLSLGFFGILLSVLEGFLSRMPLPVEILADYLTRLGLWIRAHSKSSQTELSARYRVIILLVNNTAKIYSRFRQEDKFNRALALIVKDYLENLARENSTNELLGYRGLLSLGRRIHWTHQEALELVESLLAYLEDSKHQFRSVVFEHLLQFAIICHYRDSKKISELFLNIWRDDQQFTGLTYTALSFWQYINRVESGRSDHNTAYDILSDIRTGRLTDVEASPVYPDFIDGLLLQLAYCRKKLTSAEFLALLRPMVESAPDANETPYVFYHAMRLDHSFAELFPEPADTVDRQIRLCFLRTLGIKPEQAIAEFLDLLTNNLLTIHTSIAPSLTQYLKHITPEDIPADVTKQFQDTFYQWLRTNQDKIEAAIYFTLTNAPIFFLPDQLRNLSTLAIRNMQLIPHRLSGRFFPLKFIEWWLSAEGNAHDTDATPKLLDGFWSYSLDNCHLQVGQKFVIYDQLFLFLLPRYGLDQDEHWWTTAVTALIRRLGSIVRSTETHDRFRVKKDAATEVGMFKKRLCMERMLDAILDQFVHQRHLLKGELEEAIRKALSTASSKIWAAKWIIRINPNQPIDGTRALLNYVNSLLTREANVFDMRNQVNWWFAWMGHSKRDVGEELQRIVGWFEKGSKKGISVFFLSSLLDILKNHRPKRVWGEQVLRVIKDSSSEFSEKSVLIKYYINYLRGYGSAQEQEFAEELYFFRKIALLYLDRARLTSGGRHVAYGLQTIFEAAWEFNVSLDKEKAEETFLLVSSAQMGFVEGGAIARFFFPWIFKQHESIEIGNYLDFIKTNLEKDQAPYVLTHLLSALKKQPRTLSDGLLRTLEDLLKQMIANRLDSTGTSVAMQMFFEQLVAKYESGSEERTELERVSRDVFELILQLIQQERIIYLLTSFLPFWKRLVSYPSAAEVFYVWRKLLFGKLTLLEPFARFGRNLRKHLDATDEANLIAEFYDSMMMFVETRPGDPLSAKFLSDLTRSAYIPRIYSNLPAVISKQKDLEDVAYAIGRTLKRTAKSPDDESRVEFEKTVIATLTESLYKDRSALCLQQFLEVCTPAIHYKDATCLFHAFLEQRKGKGFGTWPAESLNAIRAFYDYEERSDITAEVRKTNLERSLSIIQSTAEVMSGIRYFRGILKTWGPAYIPEQAAMTTVQALIVNVHLSKWRHILTLILRLIAIFGSAAMVSENLSLEVSEKLLSVQKLSGLISMKRDLQKSETVD